MFIGKNSNIRHENGEVKKNHFEIFFIYQDEILGLIPFMIYPNDLVLKEKLKILSNHAIWYEKDNEINEISLEVGKNIYLAKKCFIDVKKIRLRERIKNDFPLSFVLIVSLPVGCYNLGKSILKIICTLICDKYNKFLLCIIISELTKLEIIKSVEKRGIIDRGEYVKGKVLKDIELISLDYFSSIPDTSLRKSFKIHDAITFLKSKELDFSMKKDSISSKIDLLVQRKKFEPFLDRESRFELKLEKISNFEIEMIMKNISKVVWKSVNIKIMYLKELFEKEIINIDIDDWLVEEQLSILLPLDSYFDGLLISIKDGARILFTQRLKI